MADFNIAGKKDLKKKWSSVALLKAWAVQSQEALNISVHLCTLASFSCSPFGVTVNIAANIIQWFSIDCHKPNSK